MINIMELYEIITGGQWTAINLGRTIDIQSKHVHLQLSKRAIRNLDVNNDSDFGYIKFVYRTNIYVLWNNGRISII